VPASDRKPWRECPGYYTKKPAKAPRPHSSLGYRTPAAYADHLTATGHRAPLHEGSARWSVAHIAPKGLSTTEALIAAG
jgi:hypothetical protein